MMKNHSESTVHLHHDGLLHTFRPGDEIPDWASEQITNPYVRGDGAPDSAAASRLRAWAPEPERAAPAPKREQDADEEPGADMALAEGDPSRPPENGIGSGQPVWAEYARSKGIEVAADWKREDIIAACAQAGC